MKLFSGQSTITRLHWLVWVAVFFIIFFSILPEGGLYHACVYTLVNVSFYAVVIYGNINLLFPRLYQQGQKAIYVVCVIMLLVAAGLSRGYLLTDLYNRTYPSMHERMTLESVINFIVAGILTYMLSFIFRIALAYFELKQQSEKILVQKSQAELNLLKSQVQPHFLFNTLNNIYYEAYREAPNTAKLIERLSDIMRYFVDESPKDEVSLNTEIHFIENYIALEKIRIRHEIDLNFIQDCNSDLRIPPMLLMTFVENIFKHGIDKSSNDNKVELSLNEQDGYLVFQTKNKLLDVTGTEGPHGFGIENLRKRLSFLYGDRFELRTNTGDNYFIAYLKVPLI